MGILDKKSPPLSVADVEHAVERAVAKALSKTHDMPRQPAPQSARVSALMRGIGVDRSPLERPATPAPAPAKRKLPLPSGIFLERDGNGRIRTTSFVLPDGTRHQQTFVRDANGRVEALLWDDASARETGWAGTRIRRGADGRAVAMIPFETDGPVLPAPLNR